MIFVIQDVLKKSEFGSGVIFCLHLAHMCVPGFEPPPIEMLSELIKK